MNSCVGVLVLALVVVSAASGQSRFDPVAGLAKAAARTTSLMVVQCNPYIGGKHPVSGDTGKVTWETAEVFARLLAKECPQAAVIGEEEVIGLESARKMQGFLNKHSGMSWEYAFEEQGVRDRGSGLAVHWRTDKATLVKRLGSVVIDHLDNGYNLRFMGVVLAEKSTGRPFGVFCGKLVWSGAKKDGKKVGEDDRVAEARTLKAWVRRVMAPYPSAPRIIPMDMNASHGSRTFREMALEYESDGSRLHTHSSLNRIFGHSIMLKRLDYIWYDSDGGPAKKGGFLAPAGRSEHFGSDHRAVWAPVRI
ncbi:MAG: hypothetical protein HYY25_07130 [Candidatus Wallbacteria bacterium]|nr:hypothetical protein [Candidatus Wallbacteria bacterium]